MIDGSCSVCRKFDAFVHPAGICDPLFVRGDCVVALGGFSVCHHKHKVVERFFSPMDHELYKEQEVPSGSITSITFNVSTEADREKIAVTTISAVNEVSDSKLGLPNPLSECSTCGAKDLKHCEGHFGAIKFPYTILNPYYLSEVAKILNQACPGCKTILRGSWVKAQGSKTKEHQSAGCKYCIRRSIYPAMKFKVSSKDLSNKSAIVVEVDEKKLEKKLALPDDFWGFIPKDSQQEESVMKPTRRVLSHTQVHHLLKGIDQEFIKKFIQNIDSIFLDSFLVMPNNQRVTEITHAFSNGQRLIFDERTRACKKLVDFRGIANELSSRVLDCLKLTKLNLDKSALNDPANPLKKNTDTVCNTSGLRWVKDVALGKRNDSSFRMVVVGDPNIQVSEIGIPCHVAERLEVSERLNRWNWEKLSTCCSLRIIEKNQIFVRRKGSLVRIRDVSKLQAGDIIYRPLNDGDIVLVNRPPSIHQHSLIALSAKVLPITSVVSLNPLCCSPFRGDFDGDCFHGYIAQSIDTRIELSELVALERQLTNKQSGRNLLSLTHDSLTAVHLAMDDEILLNDFQMQQLNMHCLVQFQILKTPGTNSCWSGKQLFSMLLPSNFNYVFPGNDVNICNGELMSSSVSTSWLRDADGNLFQSLVNHCPDKFLDILYAGQGVLCEWLSMRGLTVSLSDLYLTPDTNSRKILMDDIFFGLQEAEQTCNFSQLMVQSCKNLLAGNSKDNQDNTTLDVEHLCYERQRSAALTQASIDAFKQVFWDIQTLVYNHSSRDNSFLAMIKAGSKGNLLKLVQHSMCLGLQNSLVPLSFRLPHQLTCTSWNNLKGDDTADSAKSYIPYAVVENSFLTGLNPFECFVHSVMSRNISFSDHADLPGTLNRRLMFFMRDIYAAYDGTVRNAYANQLVQFSYNIDEEKSSCSDTSSLFDKSSNARDWVAGQPVGSLSACALSEAAYSALDQPVSLLETSPLLNLKNVLECGLRKGDTKKTMSLYLAEKLGRRRHGYEYGALEVKNHLEGLFLSDIVSSVMIFFSPETCSQRRFSPWVCHFHVFKENVKRRGLKVHSIIDSIYMRCNSAKKEVKNFPNLHISTKECFALDGPKELNDEFCITVFCENPKNSSLSLDMIQNLVLPFLLRTVVKGFAEIKKVEILWNNKPKVPKSPHKSSFGELYLRVHMSSNCKKTNYWNMLMDNCLVIKAMIDWERSHPDNIHDFCSAYGIGAGWKFFLNNLESAVSDTGKNILPEHLALAANCLSVTGEFVGLNAKGLSKQRENATVSSPFTQACFSNPGACFIKAAKQELVDNLQGSIDALSWGRTPSVGTGGHFELIYSGQGHELAKPTDVYSLLTMSTNYMPLSYPFKGLKSLKSESKSFWKNVFTVKDIKELDLASRKILHKYDIGELLNETDKSILIKALNFHPRREEKIGCGAQEIQVGYHSKYSSSRCFSLVREDGTTEDFSYRKCVHGALEMIAPQRAESYRAKWLDKGV